MRSERMPWPVTGTTRRDSADCAMENSAGKGARNTGTDCAPPTTRREHDKPTRPTPRPCPCSTPAHNAYRQSHRTAHPQRQDHRCAWGPCRRAGHPLGRGGRQPVREAHEPRRGGPYDQALNPGLGPGSLSSTGGQCSGLLPGQDSPRSSRWGDAANPWTRGGWRQTDAPTGHPAARSARSARSAPAASLRLRRLSWPGALFARCRSGRRPDARSRRWAD